MAEIDTRITTQGIELRAEIALLGANLRSEVRQAQNTLIKWLVPLLFGQIALFGAMVKWL